MTEEICLAPGCAVAKTDSRKLFLQRFLSQVKAAQRGHFKLTPLCLAGEQCGIVAFDPAGLHNSRHSRTFVYIVNDVKVERG